MNSARDLAALARLTDAVFAAQQAEMGLLQQQEQTIRDKLAALLAARADRANALSEVETDAAQTAGADLRWHGWIETRRAILNADLSRLRVAQDKARAALALAFGRQQVAAALVGRAKAAQTKTKARRDDASY